MDRRTIDSQLFHQLYGYVLSRAGGQVIRVADLVAATGGSVEEVEEAAEQLCALGLLADEPERGLVAVSPDEAITKRIGPLERVLRAQRSHIERTREQLMSFMPVFEASLNGREPRNRFEVVEDLAEVLTAVSELAAGCVEEVFAARPGGPREAEGLEEAVPRDEAVLRRGVRMRVLYQHTACFSPGTNVYVQRVARLGAQVRTLEDYFPRLLVFDRKTAVIEMSGDPEGAAIVREPNVVDFIADMYERLWLSAKPFTVGFGPRRDVEDDLREAIVRLLTEGMTDTSIALRLGMSVRTCRRHIADLMAELNAQSRFQAGYALAKLHVEGAS